MPGRSRRSRSSSSSSSASDLRYGGLYDWLYSAAAAPYRAASMAHRSLNRANDLAGRTCSRVRDPRARLLCQNGAQMALANLSGSGLARLGARYNSARNFYNYMRGRY